MDIYLLEPKPGEKKNFCVEVILKNGNKKIVSLDEKIYLTYDKGYNFSNKPSSFSIYFSFLDLRNVRLHMQTNVLNEIKQKFIDIAVLEKKDGVFYESFAILQKAHFIETDFFLKFFEGIEFDGMRLLFLEKEPYKCYIKTGDILIYKENKWIKAQDNNYKGFDIAKILNITSNFIEIDFWEKSSFIKRKLVLYKKRYSKRFEIRENSISEIRMRTKNQITCKIENQRMMIKEKDVLFKKDKRWVKKRLEDFKKSDQNVEFLIFDSIEDRGKEKIFKGYIFNENRDSFIEIEKNITKKGFNRKKI